MIFDIVHGTNNGSAKIVSPVETVNFYPEVEDGKKSKFYKALKPCPGYRLAVTAYTEGHCRELYATSTERLFSIISNKLVEMSTSEVATVRGTLLTSIGNCKMADNGAQILIADGTYFYVYTLATNTLLWLDPIQYTEAPTNPTHVIFTDGYFLANSYGTGKFYFSGSYDGTSWSALDLATAEYSADTLEAIAKTSNGTIWMIGKESLELWNNVGVANLPWRRIAGSVKEIGTIAPYSVVSNGNSVFWLGNGKNGYGAVFMGTGYTPNRISTSAIEYQIKQLVNIENAVAYTYTDEGHSFYVISFGSEKTLVYDVSTKEWHTRGSYSSNTGTNVRNFSQGCAFFNEKDYVGSYKDGGIYEMSNSVYTENGIQILRKIITPHISSENKMLRHRKLELDMEKGVGLEGENAPVVMMRYSNDGGHTWSSKI